MGRGQHSDLVSVIIPCYNTKEYVGEAIDSVLNQTYDPIEVMVIDDGSTDESLGVIRSFGDRIAWRTGENQGACHARNWGADMASGSYLMFLDADDRIAPDTTSALVEALHGEEEAIAACPWSYLQKKEGAWKVQKPNMPFAPPTGDPIYDWLSIRQWHVPPCALLWTRAAYAQSGGWDEQVTANQDGDIALRALIKGGRFVQTQSGQAFYRNYDDSVPSISNDISARARRSRAYVLGKLVDLLRARGELDAYSIPIGQEYYNLARFIAVDDAEYSKKLLRRARQFAGHEATTGTRTHRALSRILGLQNKEKIAEWLSGIGISRRGRQR